MTFPYRTYRYLYRLLLALLVSAGCLSSLHAQTDDADVLEFAFITDTHQFGSTADVRSSSRNVSAFIDYCNSHPSLQFAAFGGDFYNSYDTNHEQGLGCLRQSAEAFRPLRLPFYTTRGNHDCNGKCKVNRVPDNTQIVTDREYHDLFNPLSQQSAFYHPEGIVNDPENLYGNYFYRDFEKQRVRVIVLNNYDRDSLEVPGYHGQQMKWLTETALDFHAKDDVTAWSFLIIGHSFTIDRTNAPVTRLLHAYVRGQDFFDTDAGVTYGRAFSYQPRARFIGIIYGHFHDDNYINWDGYNMITVSRGYATGSEVNNYEECFDHFIINTRLGTIEERRIGRGRSRFYRYDVPRQLLPGRSFPEAEGHGRFTVGGRFGTLYHVTNLADDGQGSLRWALRQEGARTIVFDVAGTIHLDSALVIRHDSITVAGQSSPGSGITLSGAPLIVDADEVIVRYLCLEQLSDRGHHYGLMVDHITAHCDTATAVSLRNASMATLQMSHISTGSETQPALLAGGFLSTYTYNYIDHSPRAIAFSDREGENRWVQVSRNLVCGWRDHAIYGGCRQGEFNVAENYFIPDSSTLHYKVVDVAEDGTARYYIRGNELKEQEKLTRHNIELVNDLPGKVYTAQPADTLCRPMMVPAAKPHASVPAPSCLVIAAFPSTMYDYAITSTDLQHKVMREAGTTYRPSKVCSDSLLLSPGYTTRHVLNYLNRLVMPERSIVILSETDVHCRIDGYPYFMGLRDPIASDTAHVAMVSCGDFLQGGMVGSITHGQAIIDVMKHIPYDAVTLGSHDFDFPQEHILKQRISQQLPIVNANLRHIETDSLMLPPYTIRHYGHRSVAYIGVTSPSTQITNALALSDSAGVLQYDFDAPNVYRRVQQAVDKARQEGANYVVVLSQLGYEPDRFGISAPALIASTTGVDAVLDGHTHHKCIPQMLLPNHEGKEVCYMQGGENFSHVGKLVIDPDGRIHSTLIPRQQMRFRHPVTAHLVDSIKNLFMNSAEDYAGHAIVNLLRPKDFTPGDSLACDAGNLVTDAMRWATDADVAWLNLGSIRQGLPMGELSRGDVLEMVPYENEMVLVYLNGKQLRAIIERLVRNLPSKDPIISPLSGFRISLRPGRGKRYRVDDIQVYDRRYSRYVPIDPDHIYRVVTTDYCISIGWRSKIFFRRQNVISTGQLYNEAVFQYINVQLNGLVESTPELREVRGVFQPKRSRLNPFQDASLSSPLSAPETDNDEM